MSGKKWLTLIILVVLTGLICSNDFGAICLIIAFGLSIVSLPIGFILDIVLDFDTPLRTTGAAFFFVLIAIITAAIFAEISEKMVIR